MSAPALPIMKAFQLIKRKGKERACGLFRVSTDGRWQQFIDGTNSAPTGTLNLRYKQLKGKYSMAVKTACCEEPDSATAQL